MKHRLAFMLLLLCSCGDIQHQKVSDLVREWQGKEIVFPKEINFTLHGEKPIDFRTPDAEYNDVMLSNVEALADGESGGKGCKLDLTSICETAHADHRAYRNR